jgi:hypothetical protein
MRIINTKMYTSNVTETENQHQELNDAMNFVEWIQLFVEQQIKSINKDSVLTKKACKIIIQQDNTSTIQLENNGKASSTKSTHHINIRYFYVTSKINRIPVIRDLEVRATVFFTSKIHALNT